MAEQIGLEAVLEDRDFRSGVSNYLSSINQMNSATSRATGTMGSAMTSLGNQFSSVMSVIRTSVIGGTAALTTALVGIGVSGVKAAMDLEFQMSGVAAILSLTTEEAKPLKQIIEDLAVDPKLKVSATEAAMAVEMLARNGLNMGEIMEGAAHSTVLLANATGADFSVAANVATDVMAQFKIGAQDMGTAVDGITSVVNNSKFSINDYALALSQGGGVASTAGVSFEDFNASIASISPLFASGSDAGTSFKTMLTSLANPSNEAKTQMDALGLSFYDAEGNLKSMAEISEMLNAALYGTSEVLVEVGGRTAEQNAELARFQSMHETTLRSIQDYTSGVKGAGLSETARAKKISDLIATQMNLEASMEPLLAITGEYTTATTQLTEEQRTAALATMFGSDAMRAGAGLAEAGAVAYTDASVAAQELGVAHEDLAWALEGGITNYEALLIKMGQTSALDSAAVRVDNLAGDIDIFKGIVEALQIQIGDALLPTVRRLVKGGIEFLTNAVTPAIEVFSAFFGGLESGMTPLSSFIEAIRDMAPANVIAGLTTLKQILNNVRLSLSGGVPFAESLGDALRIVGLDGAAVVVEKLDELSKKISALFQPVTDFIRNSFQLKDALYAIGAAITIALIPALLGVVSAVLPFLAIIGGMVLAVTTIRTAWEENWGGIQEKTAAVIAFLQTNIQTGIANIRAWWAENGEGILASATKIWTAVRTTVLEAVKTVYAYVTTAIAEIRTWWDENGEGIATGATKAWNTIKSVVTTAVAVVRNEAQVAATAIQTWWEKSGSGIVQSVQDTWKQVETAISPTLDAVRDKVLEVAGALGTSFAENGVLGTIAIGFQQFGAVLGKVGATLSENKGLIVGGISAIATGLAAFAIIPKIVAFAALLTKAWAALAAAGAFISTWYTIISGLTAAFGGWSVISGIVTTVVAAIGGPITLVLIGVAAAVAAFAVAWAKNWGGIREYTAGIFAALKAQFAPAFARLGEALTYAKAQFAGLAPTLSRLKEALGPIIAIIGTVLVANITVAIGVISSFATALIGAISWIIEGISLVITGIVTALSGIVQFVGGILGAIGALFQGDFAGAGEQLMIAWGGVKDFFVGIFTAIWGVIAGVIGAIISFIGGFVTSIYNFFYTLYMQLVGGSIVPDMVNGIYTWFMNMVNWVVGLVSGWVTSIVNFAVSLSTQFITTVTAMVESVKTWFTDMSLAVFTTVTTFVANIIAKMVEMKDDIILKVSEIKTDLEEKWLAIKSFVLQLVTEIIAGLRDKFTEMKTDAETKIGEMKTAIESKFEGIKTAMKTKIDEAIQAVKSAFTFNWATLGSNITSGIANGISNGIGNVIAAAQEMAQAAKDAIGDLLDMHSPSKVTTEQGEDTGQGFADGIENSSDVVAKAVNSAFDVPSKLGSIASTIAGIFKKNEIAPLEADLKGLDDQLKKVDVQALADTLGFTVEEFRALTSSDITAMGGIGAFGALSGEAEQYNNILSQQSALTAELAARQEHMLAIEKQQQDIALLKAQQDLLAMVKDNELSAGLLDGLKLGLDADLSEILRVTSEAMQEMINIGQKDVFGAYMGSGSGTAMGKGGLPKMPPVVLGLPNAKPPRFGGGNTYANQRTYQLNVNTNMPMENVDSQFKLMEMARG